MSTENHTPENANLLYVFGLLGGGLTVGFGAVALYYSFGYAEGEMAQNLDRLGASGLDDIGLLGAADYSIGLVIIGALVMIFLNAGAWRRTNGY